MPSIPGNAQHPLGPPTSSGTLITVDMMLQQPTRITAMVMDLSLQKFVADQIFTSGGGVTGGAVVYDVVDSNWIYSTRDAQEIGPGSEFPIITGDRRPVSIAPVKKWGGRTWISDEARDRNDTILFTNEVRRMTNTIIRKINAVAMQVVQASITASGQTFAGHSWSAVNLGGVSPTPPQQQPTGDIAAAQAKADIQELGVHYDLLLLNPSDYANLAMVYGQTLDAVFSNFGITNIISSNRVPAGTGYFVDTGQAGQMRVEKPLGTETYREPNTERTWVQASVRPVMFVTNPTAILQVTGIA
jgi:hypothetical protein